MDKVRVLVLSKLDAREGFLEEVSSVSPRIDVVDASSHFVAELRRKGIKGAKIDSLEREAGIDASSNEATMNALLAGTEVIYATSVIPDDLAARAPNLRWLHRAGVGMEGYLDARILTGHVVVTNAKGVSAVPIAEHGLLLMMMLAKDARRAINNQQNKVWDRYRSMELRGKVLNIIGMGSIGNELARLAKGIGMMVIGTRRSATRQECNVSGIDELYPRSSLLDMLPRTDVLAVSAPLTAETEGMIGEPEFRAMKPTAFVICVSRGKIIRERCLIDALKEGRIAGAGLDVFDVEPPPADSELWSLPNVLMTSHQAALSLERSQRHAALFCENLKRYLSHDQMLNVVNLEKGY